MNKLLRYTLSVDLAGLIKARSNTDITRLSVYLRTYLRIGLSISA